MTSFATTSCLLQPFGVKLASTSSPIRGLYKTCGPFWTVVLRASNGLWLDVLDHTTQRSHPPGSRLAQAVLLSLSKDLSQTVSLKRKLFSDQGLLALELPGRVVFLFLHTALSRPVLRARNTHGLALRCLSWKQRRTMQDLKLEKKPHPIHRRAFWF